MTNELIIIPCPPFPEYPVQPADQSHCELILCPKCDKEMWRSENKLSLMIRLVMVGEPFFLACYPCVTKFMEEEANKQESPSSQEINAWPDTYGQPGEYND